MGQDLGPVCQACHWHSHPGGLGLDGGRGDGEEAEVAVWERLGALAMCGL